MGWTPAQIKAAKALYNRKGNRLSWPECIKRATKGGTTKRRAVSGKKKVAPRKKVVTVKKRTAVKRTVKISGTAGVATTDLVNTQRKIEAETRAIDVLKNRSLAGMGAAEKKQHRSEVARRKGYLQTLKQHKTAVKRFI